MSIEERPEDSYALSWGDLEVVLRRSKRKIIAFALFCALLAAFFTLSRDVTYTAKGTFREKNKQSNNNEKTLSALLLSGGATSAESMAITTIKSRRVLENVVREFGLQGVVKPKDNRGAVVQRLIHYLGNIYDNLVVEEAYLAKKYKPVVKDPPQDLVLKDVDYGGEVALVLELRPENDGSFSLYDKEGRELGGGRLGELISFGEGTFSVHSNVEGQLPKQTYILSLSPMPRVAESLLANLVVEADKLDKTLLKVSYFDTDRHKSSQLLNAVMSAYRSFLIDEHVRVTADQVAYLKERQEDMDRQLMALMEDHAVNIASNDASIEFLVKTQQNYKSKLLNIDLETKHLEKAQQEGIAFFERHSADGESPVVQNLLGEIRKYRQQADTLEVALRNTHVHPSDFLQEAFNQYVEELQETHELKSGTEWLLAEVEQGGVPQPPEVLMVSAKYLVRPWHERLQQAVAAKGAASSTEELKACEEEFGRCRANFAAYLANLLHLFEVQEKTIQDRLTHQQNPQMEFQGIDLETANTLYVNYARELHSLEADLAQKEFIIQQLSQPEFEVSSINSIMDDAISREIINKTSSLMLSLKDEPNRTSKEMERLRRDIEIQKGCLGIHLKQMCDILHLREQLLEDKIHSLQNMILELVRQKISIQEKHLADYINSRLNNLKHEKLVITQHQKELQDELDVLPEKWASQKLIDQHLQSNMNIVHQIASMIESKTIAENLEVSQSAPFDAAVTPVLPRDPRLFLFMSIGAFGGAFLSFCFCLVQSAASGVEATPDNLRAIHQSVAGSLASADSFENAEGIGAESLETLRKLIVDFSPLEVGEGKAKRFALIEAGGPHYAPALATLMSKRGLKVLLLPLSFYEESSGGGGLLDVLEGRASDPKVMEGLYYDTIASGGASLFSNELLESLAFEQLLEGFSLKYDCIIGYSNAVPVSAEAECLLRLFPCIAVMLSGEKLEELKCYFEASQKGNTVSFLFYQ